MTTTIHTETIRLIDRRIDGVRLELFRRGCRFNTFSAAGWRQAWDRHPDLHAHHETLSGLRGLAQFAHYEELNRLHRAEQRRIRRVYRQAA